MPTGPRAVGVTLLAALAASQAALVVLNPLLPDVARDLDVSIATAGQLRTVSGLAAGVAALATGLLATRIGLRGLLLGAIVILACGSLVERRRAGLRRARRRAGARRCRDRRLVLGRDRRDRRVVDAGDRSRVLALTLLGPPLAWIVGMPLVGLLGEIELATRVARRAGLDGRRRDRAPPPAARDTARSARAGLRRC